MSRSPRALGVLPLLLLTLIAVVACSGSPAVSPSATTNQSPAVAGSPVVSASPSEQATPGTTSSDRPRLTDGPPSPSARAHATPTDQPAVTPDPTETPITGGTPSPSDTPIATGTPTAPDPPTATETPSPSDPASPTTSPSAGAPSSAPPSSPAPGGSIDPSGGSRLTPELTAKLQKILERTAKRTGIAGISVAVLLDDGSSWSGVTGDRVLKSDTPVDAETVFSIASITKTFVTAVVMQLVADGKLSLDDRLDQWVPDVPQASKITVAELLGHTSGVYNYFENPHYNNRVFSDRKHRWTFDEILTLVGSPYCKPGRCYHYSNTNFVLLGRIVELVTGRPLAEEIAERLSGPLSLEGTGLQPDDPTPDDRAHGYAFGNDWTRKSSMLPNVSAATVAGAAGAMVSTASDLATWSKALYGGQVVPAAELDEMLSFRKCHDNYGLGTRKLLVNGRVAYGHLGSLRGYTNEMLTFPREGATVVILSNQGNWNITGAMQKLTDALWEGIGASPPQYAPSTNTTIHDGTTLYC